MTSTHGVTAATRLMEVDRLKRDLSFAKYMKALDGMPVLGSIEAGGRELFSKMETVFFEEFTASFADHIESVWRTNEILLYLLGGNPRLAKLTASWSWLFSFEENAGADEQGNAAIFEWPDDAIDVEGHDISGGSVHIKTADCMKYLTENADPMAILSDPLIMAHKGQLWKMAGSKSNPSCVQILCTFQ